MRQERASTATRCLLVSTVAGQPPPAAAGYSGDGGLAINARLNNPTGVTVDASTGYVYVTDRFNHVVSAPFAIGVKNHSDLHRVIQVRRIIGGVITVFAGIPTVGGACNYGWRCGRVYSGAFFLRRVIARRLSSHVI